MTRFVVILCAAMMATSAIAQAKPSLWSFPRVDQGLFDIGVAYGISENCSSLEERKIYGASFALSLSNYAQSQGYSFDEVRNFVRDDEEKAKLRVRVTKFLEDQGLDPSVPNALCDYGKDQIAAETQVGKFLRKN
ncbi:MAG: DUF5333 domain-containing protein [Pseudomonadota bacterium]